MTSPRILLLLVLALVGALLFVGWPVPNTAWWAVAEDSGHVPLFALLTFALFAEFRARDVAAPVHAYIRAAIVAAILGGVTELIQIPVGRDASWTDLWHDGLGIGGALALRAAVDRRLGIRRLVRAGLILLSVSSLIPIALPIVRVARAYAYRAQLFPRLADFSTDRDSFWTVGVGARRIFRPGSLEVDFVAERYPGVSWFEPEPDWSRFGSLVLDIENPNDSAMEVTLRVHDRQHRSSYSDRFNREFDLAPNERRTVRVSTDDIAQAPRGRRLDLAHIAGVAVFRSGPPGPRRMIIYALKLEQRVK